MITIKTYIKLPHKIISNLDEVEKNPSEYFIALESTRKLLEIQKELDADYLEGAIVLFYNDEVVLYFTHWDLVDQLWEYLLDLIEQMHEHKTAKIYFPDQPIQLILQEHDHEYILLTLVTDRKQTWKLSRKEFFQEVLIGAKTFFQKMVILFDDSVVQYQKVLTRINELKKRLFNSKTE